jgi:poly(A) polymerase
MRGGAEKLTSMLHRLFPNETTTPHQLGAGYPIWQITFKDDIELQGKVYATSGAVIEFVDTQKEMFPDPDSRQRTVEYGTLAEDIERRDFTVNMLLKDLTTGEIVDLTGTSLKDIQDGVLRGHPGVDFDKILRDDPLRMIRLIRFQAKYGWSVPLSVLKAVRRNASRIQIISAERINAELTKVMELGKLAQAVRMMKAVGLLQYVLPEVQAMSGVEHEYSRGVHQEGDVLRHTLLVLQNAKPGVESQLSALLHDVGKPASQQVIDGLIRFIGHEKVSGEIAEAIMRRLKFDTATVKRVRTIVENHMRPHHLTHENAGPTGMRRFIREVGAELVDAVLDLAEADQLGNIPPKNLIPDLRREIDILRAPVLQAEKLPVDGKDVQRILGIKPGKLIGDVLKWLQDKKFDLSQEGQEMTKDLAESLILKHFSGRQ